jgi:hypothetical protein
MATQDYSNASSLLRNTAPRVVVDPSSRPTDLISLLIARQRFVRVADLGGAEPYVWSLVTANNSTAERFTEGQALPAGTRRGFVNPSVNAFYWREVVRVTGRAADIARNNGYVEANLLQSEQQNATLNMLYVMEQDLLGSTVNLGLPSIIDDTASYGGVNPGTYTVHASKVSTGVGNQSAATLADHYEAITSPPYNTVPTDILMPPNQITNYTGIAGLHGGTAVTRMMLPATQGYDVGVPIESASYQGHPIRRIRNATSTETLWVNLNDVTIGVQRDIEYLPLAQTADDTVGQVSFAGLVIVKNRRLHSKQTGVSA